MCSAIPRRIAVIGSTVSPGSVSPAATGAGAGGFAGGAGALTGGAGGAGVRLRRRPELRPERLGCRCGPGPAAALLLRAAGLDEGEDVLLRHAAARAGAGDLRRIDAVLGCDARHDRATRTPSRCPTAPALRVEPEARERSARESLQETRRRPRRPPRRWPVPAQPRAAGFGLGRALGRGSLAAGAAADLAELRADVDRLAFLDEDLRQRPGGRARHLGVDLVGRDLEQRLVGLDLLALLLQPARDRPLRDGHAHLRHHDVDCGLRGHAAPS